MAKPKLNLAQLQALFNRAAVEALTEHVAHGGPHAQVAPTAALVGTSDTVAIPAEVAESIRLDLSKDEFFAFLQGRSSGAVQPPRGAAAGVPTERVEAPAAAPGLEAQLQASIDAVKERKERREAADREEALVRGWEEDARRAEAREQAAREQAASEDAEECAEVAVEASAFEADIARFRSRPVFSFLTGPAGSGKTYIVRAEAASPAAGIVLCATTGIAAVNLGEGVTTINSLLKYFDTASLRDAWTGGWLKTQLMRLHASGIDELCIDEVSMLDGHQLDILVASVGEVNQDLELDGKDLMRLRLTGDFAQLPPVKAPYAFERPSWKDFDANTQVLTTQYRQSNPDFLEALANARRGGGLKAADYFAPFCKPNLDYGFGGTTIMAKNDAVDKFNLFRFGQINEPIVNLPSQRWGKDRPEWKEIPFALSLKKGALVMVLANRQAERRDEGDEVRYEYVNGDLGVVEDIDVSKYGSSTRPVPWVRLKRNDQVLPIGYVTRQHKIPLEPGRRKALREAGHPERVQDRFEIIGEVTYMPLRLAWATTCHKSQGLTLELAQIDIRDRFFSTPGMAYVALSRVRSPNGLNLVAAPQQLLMKFVVDPRVRRWL